MALPVLLWPRLHDQVRDEHDVRAHSELPSPLATAEEVVRVGVAGHARALIHRGLHDHKGIADAGQLLEGLHTPRLAARAAHLEPASKFE